MNIQVIRDNFPWFKHNKNVCYFDNAATSLKPKSVISTMNEYYEKYCFSSHNQDHIEGYKIKQKIEKVRNIVSDFINCDEKEVVFTPSTTQGINDVANMLRNSLKKGDEIILNELEHASNLLPWYKLRNEVGIIIKFVSLVNGIVDEQSIINEINQNTKVISIAHANNTYGNLINIQQLSKKIKEINSNIFIIIDAAQSIAHHKINIKNLNIDFLVFSAHKIFGPTGTGILYINKKLDFFPANLGGDMNNDFTKDEVVLKNAPHKYESGTLNISGILGLGKCIEFINLIGYDFIEKRENELRKYAINKLKTSVKSINIYNSQFKSTNIIFNVKNTHPHDVATYLGEKNIIVRSGQMCARLTKNSINYGFVRASFAFYNTFEEIDYFVKTLKEAKTFLTI